MSDNQNSRKNGWGAGARYNRNAGRWRSRGQRWNGRSRGWQKGQGQARGGQMRQNGLLYFICILRTFLDLYFPHRDEPKRG